MRENYLPLNNPLIYKQGSKDSYKLLHYTEDKSLLI